MNRTTIAALALFVAACAISGWLLTRSGEHPPTDEAAGPGSGEPRAGMTFAEWSVRSDGVLLADIDPGHGVSTVPRRFLSLTVTRSAGKPPVIADGPAFPWGPSDRAASGQGLFALGFRVSAEGRAYVPPEDPLWSDPIQRVEAGTEQTVTLRSRGGTVATLLRRRGDPQSAPYWNRRAIGFASPDGSMVYVTPDAVIIPMASR
jgi:hypothetical protein